MSIEELIEKGLIKTCDKHGVEVVYFDATQECPVCKVVIQSKPLNKKKTSKIPEPVKPEIKKNDPENTEPMGMVEKWKSFSIKKKVILIAVCVVILWLMMNLSSLVSYFK
jgi:uncharacterized Zn finger protein (UPF0148 family)